MKIPGAFWVRAHFFDEPLPDKHEGHTRESLDAFSRRAYHHVNMRLSDIERLSSQCADGIKYKHAILIVDNFGDLVDGVQESGRRLMVHHSDDMHFWMLTESKQQPFGIGANRPLILQLTDA